MGGGRQLRFPRAWRVKGSSPGPSPPGSRLQVSGLPGSTEFKVLESLSPAISFILLLQREYLGGLRTQALAPAAPFSSPSEGAQGFPCSGSPEAPAASCSWGWMVGGSGKAVRCQGAPLGEVTGSAKAGLGDGDGGDNEEAGPVGVEPECGRQAGRASCGDTTLWGDKPVARGVTPVRWRGCRASGKRPRLRSRAELLLFVS